MTPSPWAACWPPARCWPSTGRAPGWPAPGARLEPDPELHGRLIEAGASPAAVASTDLFYDHPAQVVRESGQAATAVDLQAAAILGVAARRGVAAACLVGVATGLRDPEALEALSVRLGEAGYAALRIP